MDNEENLDLLDLDDGTNDSLPDVAPLVAPRPKKPWLLLGVGLAIIVLATYVIVRTVGNDSLSSMEIDLDSPAVVVDGDVAPLQPKVEPTKAPVKEQQPAPQPVEKTAPVAAEPVVPVRVVEDRKDVTFNPDKVTSQPKPAAQKTVSAPKPVAKTSANTWYVQLGSYSSRALAEKGERQLRSAHSGLFEGQQTTILAAVLKNGSTTYRLRVVFNNQQDANSFCRNAKSDGLECYVAK